MVQSAALLFSVCWLFTNVVVLNLVIAMVLERFRLKDSAKLGIQRKEVLKAARTTHVSHSLYFLHPLHLLQIGMSRSLRSSPKHFPHTL